MSEAKFTPRPWRFDGKYIIDPSHRTLAKVFGGNGLPNGTLMAAAPEMYEALKRVLLDIDFMVESGTLPDIRGDIIYEAARAAIAKAEGK